MDFFEHQDRARKHTGRLVFLFVVGVVSVACLVGLLIVMVFGVGASRTEGSNELLSLQWPVAAGTSLLTMVVISLASMGKSAQLKFGGGRMVAESLGGRLVTRETASPEEKRLLNVVEEMAIASGVPTPPVYVMDRENGINAFAAGNRPESAVIGVTRGTVQTMSRDELQGIIAHEFSHILNGDMRINIRLIGWIFGLIVISIAGRVLLRSMWYTGSGVRVRSSRDRDSGGGQLAIIGLGIGLMVLGAVGSFFGRLIQAAISRQREFLADASAVQFTRNPDGIGSALKKIAGVGSRIENPHASECSHMFFGSYASLSSVFATHPPINERIARIDPRWAKLTSEQRSMELRELKSRAVASLQGGRGAAGFAGAETSSGSVVASVKPSTAVIESIGKVHEHRVDFAERAVAAMPKRIREAAGEPFGATALLMAIVYSNDNDVQQVQEQTIQGLKIRGLTHEVRSFVPILDTLDPVLRLPTLDLLLPTLAALSEKQRTLLVGAVLEMIRADQRVDLFEWALHRIVSIHLRGGEPLVMPRRTLLTREQPACTDVMSVLASAGAPDAESAGHAFARGVGVLSQAGIGTLRYESGRTLRDLDQGLDMLDNLSIAHKRVFLLACAAVVVDDRVVTVAEAELLRAVADSLGVPVPPIVLELRSAQLASS
ncbi:MAG: M48 family metallopeptidase [Phycisphaeraceae bacterium]|nr:M48 family metallopeptidase [Phycisphaerales bacterium]MCB9860634.1 M48 family metallopeptidase [Phycisphaeraceae bacterium]